jgi:hypothetical protein
VSVYEAPAASVDWCTPGWVFEALGVTFDLDPCGPAGEQDIPAGKWCARMYRPPEDGLIGDWYGLVWLNPPWSGRLASPFLRRAAEHADHGGSVIAALPARPGEGWFHRHVFDTADLLLWHEGRIAYQRPDGTLDKAPPVGTVFAAWGRRGVQVLARSSLRGIRQALVDGPAW